MIKSKGRMIRTDIRKSHKIASLSPESLALFCLLIPHFSAHGKMNGDLHFVKGEVAPLVEWLTIKKIQRCLSEITEKTNVKWFEKDGLWYLHSLNWSEHQYLRQDRMVEDSLPSYSSHDKSMTSPCQVSDKPCIEVEVEGKDKGNTLSGKPDAAEPILYLNKKTGKNFSTDPKSTNIKFVKARIAEGRCIADFITVIDRKFTDWATDEKMAQYLRPETLFNATKFESYLNQPEPKKKDGLDAYMGGDEKKKRR